MRKTRGISFVEILVSLVIFGVLIGGLITLFSLCFQWNDDARDNLIAMAQIQNKIEEIRGWPYNEIPAAFSKAGSQGDTFALTGINGTGVIYVDSTNSDLLHIRVSACWRGTRNGRIFGEDKDLNGALDSGEDANGNNLIDSPASLTVLIARR